MKRVSIREAKANLARLIHKACHGEEVVITRGSQPVVRLLPIKALAGPRRLGILKGKLIVGPEFFAPLSADDLDGWQ